MIASVRVFGQVAQSVEHMTENHGVGGSIPSLATKYYFERYSSYFFLCRSMKIIDLRFPLRVKCNTIVHIESNKLDFRILWVLGVGSRSDGGFLCR